MEPSLPGARLTRFVRAFDLLFRAVRMIAAFQFVAAAGGTLVGLATSNPRLALAGLGQVVFAGVIIAVGSLDGGGEEVSELRRDDGVHVVRMGPRRAWRDARGWKRIRLLVAGHRVWQVVVRRREDDPFGPVGARTVVSSRTEAEETVAALHRGIHHRVRRSP